MRLDKQSLALTTYLSARSRLVRKRVRQLKVNGDSRVFAENVSLIYVILIKNTYEVFMVAFQHSRTLSSAFISWAKDEIENLRNIFDRQLYGIDRNSYVFQYVSNVMCEHFAILQDIGLDMTFLLGLPDPSNENNVISVVQIDDNNPVALDFT